jgi:hypothetical protein
MEMVEPHGAEYGFKGFLSTDSLHERCRQKVEKRIEAQKQQLAAHP